MPTDPLEVPGKREVEEEDVNPWGRHTQRLKEGKLQLLEEDRLGPMIVKTWKGGYENVREILEEVRSYLEEIGVTKDGEDEVLLDDGRKWEDVFMVVSRRMVCAGGGKLDMDDIYALNTDTILSKTTSTRIFCSTFKEKSCQESVDEPAIFAYHPFIRMSFVQRGQARPGQTGLRRRKKGLSEKQNKTPLAEENKHHNHRNDRGEESSGWRERMRFDAQRKASQARPGGWLPKRSTIA